MINLIIFGLATAAAVLAHPSSNAKDDKQTSPISIHAKSKIVVIGNYISVT
jgi:hypothetical protein